MSPYAVVKWKQLKTAHFELGLSRHNILVINIKYVYLQAVFKKSAFDIRW